MSPAGVVQKLWSDCLVTQAMVDLAAKLPWCQIVGLAVVSNLVLPDVPEVAGYRFYRVSRHAGPRALAGAVLCVTM